MRVRDAVEEDGEALGTLADAPAEVMRNVVHDRTVRIAEDSEADNAEIVGFVGFDATPGTVRVTYLRGSPSACERLLEEPVRFAWKEEMAVEALVPERETETRTVVEAAGFERTGDGPRFDGSRTLKYRLAPPSE